MLFKRRGKLLARLPKHICSAPFPSIGETVAQRHLLRAFAPLGEPHSRSSTVLRNELYAGLFEPDVVRFDLWNPPASHRQGPTFLNVWRILDMPQAVALAYPRAVRIYVKSDAEAKAWDWPMRLQEAMGEKHLAIRQVKD